MFTGCAVATAVQNLPYEAAAPRSTGLAHIILETTGKK
jgi:hypothetical protein